MSARIAAVVVFVVTISLANRADAQQKTPGACAVQAKKITDSLKISIGAANPCTFVAAVFAEPYKSEATLKGFKALETKDVAKATAPRELQTRSADKPAAAGAASQADAVPSTQPVPGIAASLATVGGANGNDAITAFTINPAIFFGPVSDTKKAAGMSRIADLTVLIPANNIDANKDGNIDYFGIRARVNFVGRVDLSQVTAAYNANQAVYTRLTLALDTLFRDALDPAACIAQYAAKNIDSLEVSSACGGRWVDLRFQSALSDNLRSAVRDAREKTDARYVGLDLRLDRGDPTLGATPRAFGTGMFVGLAFGKRLTGSDENTLSYSIKGRLGAANIELDDKTLPDSVRRKMSLDAAGALEFSFPSAFQPVKLSSGFEYRRGNVAPNLEEALRTDVTTWRISVDIPITPNNSVSVAFAKPVVGKGKPTLSVNANWQMLLSALAGGAAR